MKMFVEPEILVEQFRVEDVITVSADLDENDTPITPVNAY